MTALLVDDLAQFIRRVDGDDKLPADVLGNRIMCEFYGVFADGRRAEVAGFVERTNPDKRMGAGRLAELIVAEFGLDEEG